MAVVRKVRKFAFLAVVLIAALASWQLASWYVPSALEEERPFIVPQGSSLTSVAHKMEDEGFIPSANRFLTFAKLLGGSEPVKAGEFLLPVPASGNQILTILQSGDALRRLVTIPEGLPSIDVHERLMAEPLLTGEIAIPAEGSVLPESYDFERGEARGKVLSRMQHAMDEVIAELWPKRSPSTAVKTPEEAIILAAIVEKETGVPEELGMVAGLYSNRLRQGMKLQADPTIIYPITRGRPLGRRIRRTEIAAVNGYNTYSMVGLPDGPITNPGRAAIEAVLNPAQTKALFMVADGSGGHAFGETLAEHEANVEKWYALRRQRGEM